MAASPGVPAPPYPVSVEFERGLEVPRWRPLVNWILVIPHIIVLYVLQLVYGILALVSFFTVLFTKRIPDGILGVQAMIDRYYWRVTTFHSFMRDEYPPFSFNTTQADDGVDPARSSIEDPGEMNRWLPLIKWLLVIPHLIVLIVLFVAVAIVWIIAFFAVLFTGRYPEGLRAFIIGVSRWYLRVTAYTSFRTDVYPPFRLGA
jgi:hypothetical protein